MPISVTNSTYSRPPTDIPEGYRILRNGEFFDENCLFWSRNGWIHEPGLNGVQFDADENPNWRNFIITKINPLVQPEPAPVKNGEPAMWDLVIQDMRARDQFGREKYGTPLQAHNGRDVLRDLYQELLDAAVYVRQAIYERDGE